MTTTEFSNEFDILYNSIATNAAPEIDAYEKSVYLSKAQLEIVKNYFNPKGNKYQEGFEYNSKRRYDFRQLIKHKEELFPLGQGMLNLPKIDERSVFYKLPEDLFLIILEQAELGFPKNFRFPPIENDEELKKFQKELDRVKCVEGNRVNIKPKSHDEINVQIKNPFKNPASNVVWRVDISNLSSNNKNVELISDYPIRKYILRYVKTPRPIILENLNDLFPGENLSVFGVNTQQTSEIDENSHPEILDRAVELAMADYKPEMLGIKAQMSSRNE